MSEYLIGLDIGTSAVKGVLLDVHGTVTHRTSREVILFQPQKGQYEIPLRDHYKIVCDVVNELVSFAPDYASIKGISTAVASGNTLLIDRDGNSIGNIISWLDERAVGSGKQLLPDLDTRNVHHVVGWPWIEMFPMAHLAWLKENRSDEYKRASHIGMNIDNLYHQWTGKWVLDNSTATTFYLQDQISLKWYKPYLEMLEIPESSLSELVPTGTVIGPMINKDNSDIGLNRKTIVVAGSFDHPAAAKSVGVLNGGDLLLSCGTSWAGLYPFSERDKVIDQQQLVDTFLYPHGPWAVLTPLRGIGNTIEWFINQYIRNDSKNVFEKYEQFNLLANRAPIGANNLYLDLTRESLEKEKSTIVEKHSKSDIARAVMEGAAFAVKKKIDQLKHSAIEINRIAMVGGPSESPIWPQIVSDCTGLELELNNGKYAGAVGAAIIAGVGLGIYADEQDAFNNLQGEVKTITPNSSAFNKYTTCYQQFLNEFFA